MTGLLSMTGHGRAQQTSDGLAIDAEVRSVNNRFLKVTFKLHESVAFLETQIETLVRERVRRGSVHVTLRVSGSANLSANRVCAQALGGYVDQVRGSLDASIPISIEIGSTLQLPGVLVANEGLDPDKITSLAMPTLGLALDDLNRMRKVEGAQMGRELIDAIGSVRTLASQIEQRAPSVLSEYRRRLESKVRSALVDLGHSVADVDLLREVVLFSDRSDIREEIVRLNSHLDQYLETIQSHESQGRRLDFLTQEIARETNTIGAKANDAAIAHLVVAVKTAVEQMRELVQNVE
jgi:uncharacterized protein (TIGR00255 family)